MSVSDPYELDSTDFGQFFKMDRFSLPEDEDIPEEPSHPLAEAPRVRDICKYLEGREEELMNSRKPNGEMSDDPYFKFNEGLIIRPEVVVMFCLDYFKAHPEALS